MMIVTASQQLYCGLEAAFWKRQCLVRSEGAGSFAPQRSSADTPEAWCRLPSKQQSSCAIAPIPSNMMNPDPGEPRRFCFRICLWFSFSGDASWWARVVWAGCRGKRQQGWRSAGWTLALVMGWWQTKSPVQNEQTGANRGRKEGRKECLKKIQQSWPLIRDVFIFLGHYPDVPFAQFSLKGKKCWEQCLSKTPLSPLADRSVLQTLS